MKCDVLHDRDAGCVELVDHLLWRDTDGADEECGLVSDDDVHEFRQLSIRVIILLTSVTSVSLLSQIPR